MSEIRKRRSLPPLPLLKGVPPTPPGRRSVMRRQQQLPFWKKLENDNAEFDINQEGVSAEEAGGLT